MSLLTRLFDVTPLCVENNTIFTQMLENKRPLCREQYNIYTDASKQKNLCVTLVTSDVMLHSRYSCDVMILRVCAVEFEI